MTKQDEACKALLYLGSVQFMLIFLTSTEQRRIKCDYRLGAQPTLTCGVQRRKS